MEIVKSYTDLEQSQKLAEILPLESADMLYYCNKDNKKPITQIPFIRTFKENDIFLLVPCWSLTALFSVLPNGENQSTTELSKGMWVTPPLEYIDKWFCQYEDIHDGSYYHRTSADNPIDACVEMIFWLKEKGRL